MALVNGALLEAKLDGFRRRGFALAYRLLGNADDAADAVQDALTVLWSKRRAVDRSQDPTAWFFRVVRNRCIDQLRRRSVRRHELLTSEGPVDRRCDSPDDAMQRDELQNLLDEAIKELDFSQREILLLRDYQNLSYAQIAEVLAISPGTVMSRLHRARMNLRERLKDRW